MKKVLFMAALIGLIGCQKEELTEKKGEVRSTPCTCVLPYSSYVAKITQVGTDDPTANILWNDTGGTITWVRDQVGGYRAVTSFTINPDKVFIYVGEEMEEYCADVYVSGYNASTNEIFIQTLCDGTDADGELHNTSIEFRFY